MLNITRFTEEWNEFRAWIWQSGLLWLWGLNSPLCFCITSWQTDWCLTCSEQKHGFSPFSVHDTAEAPYLCRALITCLSWQEVWKVRARALIAFSTEWMGTSGCVFELWVEMNKPPPIWSFLVAPYLHQSQLWAPQLSQWSTRGGSLYNTVCKNWLTTQ